MAYVAYKAHGMAESPIAAGGSTCQGVTLQDFRGRPEIVPRWPATGSRRGGSCGTVPSRAEWCGTAAMFGSRSRFWCPKLLRVGWRLTGGEVL